MSEEGFQTSNSLKTETNEITLSRMHQHYQIKIEIKIMYNTWNNNNDNNSNNSNNSNDNNSNNNNEN